MSYNLRPRLERNQETRRARIILVTCRLSSDQLLLENGAGWTGYRSAQARQGFVRSRSPLRGLDPPSALSKAATIGRGLDLPIAPVQQFCVLNSN